MKLLASVAINGSTRSRVITQPFSAPKSPPAARPASAASQIGTPATFHSCAITTADSPATAPTERSIPPVRITTDSPSATRPNGRKLSPKPSRPPSPG